jgi:hypothetical protein
MLISQYVNMQYYEFDLYNFFYLIQPTIIIKYKLYEI